MALRACRPARVCTAWVSRLDVVPTPTGEQQPPTLRGGIRSLEAPTRLDRVHEKRHDKDGHSKGQSGACYPSVQLPLMDVPSGHEPCINGWHQCSERYGRLTAGQGGLTTQESWGSNIGTGGTGARASVRRPAMLDPRRSCHHHRLRPRTGCGRNLSRSLASMLRTPAGVELRMLRVLSEGYRVNQRAAISRIPSQGYSICVRGCGVPGVMLRVLVIAKAGQAISWA